MVEWGPRGQMGPPGKVCRRNAPARPPPEFLRTEPPHMDCKSLGSRSSSDTRCKAALEDNGLPWRRHGCSLNSGQTKVGASRWQKPYLVLSASSFTTGEVYIVCYSCLSELSLDFTTALWATPFTVYHSPYCSFNPPCAPSMTPSFQPLCEPFTSRPMVYLEYLSSVICSGGGLLDCSAGMTSVF